MGLVKVNFDIIIRTLLPISTRRYWFATIYVGMYLLLPLNRLISGLSTASFVFLHNITHSSLYCPKYSLLADAWNAEWLLFSLVYNFISCWCLYKTILFKTNPSDISIHSCFKKSSFTTYLHKLSRYLGILYYHVWQHFKYYLPAFNVILVILYFICYFT